MYEVGVMPDVCTRARHIMTGVAQNRRAKYTLRSLEAVRVSIAPMAVDKYSQEPQRMRTIAWAAILTTIAILTQVLVGQRPAATDDSLLITRRLVWTAFFSNDQNKLKELLPENLVAGVKTIRRGEAGKKYCTMPLTLQRIVASSTRCPSRM
jgi:hypothetical protein